MQEFDLCDLKEFRLILKKDHTAHISLMKDHVDNLAQHVKLIESEKRIEKEARVIRMDNNVIKKLQLREKVKDLQIQLHKSSLEALEILDGKVFDLRKKRDNLLYVIKMRKADHKRLLEEISRVPKVRVDPFLAEHQRKFEYVLWKSLQKYGEAWQMGKKYKAVRSLLREEMITLPRKVEVMEAVRKKQLSVIKDVLKKRRVVEKKHNKTKAKFVAAEVKAITACHEKDISMYDYCQFKEQRIVFLRHEARRKDEEEVVDPDVRSLVMQLRKLRDIKQQKLDYYDEIFSAIKKTTLISDIRQARHRILTQRKLWENLREVRLKAEESMKTATVESKKYQRKLDVVRGKELRKPLNIFKMEIIISEKVLEEEKMKRNTILKRLHENKVTLVTLKTKVWHILKLLELHMPSEVEQVKLPHNLPVHTLFQRVGQILEKLLKTLEDMELPAVREKIREAAYQKKIEELKAEDEYKPAPMPEAKPIDYFSSDDEHNERRIQIKKEANRFAEMKKRIAHKRGGKT